MLCSLLPPPRAGVSRPTTTRLPRLSIPGLVAAGTLAASALGPARFMMAWLSSASSNERLIENLMSERRGVWGLVVSIRDVWEECARWRCGVGVAGQGVG